MSERLELLIRNARLPDSPEALVDMGISKGKVTAVEAGMASPAQA